MIALFYNLTLVFKEIRAMELKGIKGIIIISIILLIVLVPLFLKDASPVVQLLLMAIGGIIALAFGGYFFYKEYYE